jgi:hypothetical protein
MGNCKSRTLKEKDWNRKRREHLKRKGKIRKEK